MCRLIQFSTCTKTIYFDLQLFLWRFAIVSAPKILNVLYYIFLGYHWLPIWSKFRSKIWFKIYIVLFLLATRLKCYSNLRILCSCFTIRSKLALSRSFMIISESVDSRSVDVENDSFKMFSNIESKLLAIFRISIIAATYKPIVQRIFIVWLCIRSPRVRP